jgi:hypothetical protein
MPNITVYVCGNLTTQYIIVEIRSINKLKAPCAIASRFLLKNLESSAGARQILKPNSLMYNFVEVSGHNLESSQT